MNLIEALKQPYPIKRTAWAAKQGMDFTIDPKYLLELLGRGDMRPWSQEDLLADDWQAVPPARSISAHQFWGAYGEALKRTEERFPAGEPRFYTHAGFLVRTMAVELGLADGCKHEWVPVSRTYDKCLKCGERQ